MQIRLLKLAGGLSKHHSGANQARGRAVFDNSGEALWGCADQTVSLNTPGIMFACLSGRGYLSNAERSVNAKLMCVRVRERNRAKTIQKNEKDFTMTAARV